MTTREEREKEIGELLGVDPRHPMVIEAVEIERGERNRDGSWIAPTSLADAAQEMFDALHAILLQIRQGKVFERDACITQATAAYSKGKAAGLVHGGGQSSQ